jgi:NADH:ubiquinone oxidoreductase subunit 6 (subunit J)
VQHYVGAIVVLFLFIVMMLNIKIAEIHENVLRCEEDNNSVV